MNSDQKRQQRLMPNGIPRYVRAYDNGGKTFDRYTVVFTGRYRKTNFGTIYLGLSEHPYHPQGFGQHGFSDCLIDRPAYAHLGKRVSFNDLPLDCQNVVCSTYCDIWNI